MYQIKTKITDKDILTFLNSIEDEQKKDDCLQLLDFFKKETKIEPKLWSNNIIGYVEYSYVSKSGCQGNWFKVGFSPKKAGISIYVLAYNDEIEKLRKSLGKAKYGKSCIVIKKLEDINLNILKKMVQISLKNNLFDNEKEVK